MKRITIYKFAELPAAVREQLSKQYIHKEFNSHHNWLHTRAGVVEVWKRYMQDNGFKNITVLDSSTLFNAEVDDLMKVLLLNKHFTSDRVCGHLVSVLAKHFEVYCSMYSVAGNCSHQGWWYESEGAPRVICHVSPRLGRRYTGRMWRMQYSNRNILEYICRECSVELDKRIAAAYKKATTPARVAKHIQALGYTYDKQGKVLYGVCQ